MTQFLSALTLISFKTDRIGRRFGSSGERKEAPVYGTGTPGRVDDSIKEEANEK